MKGAAKRLVAPPASAGSPLCRPLLVEFVGLPGSGKSVLQEKVAEALSLRGYSAWTPRAIFDADNRVARQKPSFLPRPLAGFWRQVKSRVGQLILWVTTLAASSKLLWLTVPRLLTSKRAMGDKGYSLHLLLGSLVSVRYIQERARPGQIILLGEGPAQRADAIFVDRHSSFNAKAIILFARLMPRPDVLIYLRVNAAVSAERIKNRERGLPRRLKGLNSAQLNDWLVKDQQVFDALVVEVKLAGGERVSVVTLDTDDLDQVNRQFEECLLPVITRLIPLNSGSSSNEMIKALD